VGEGEGEGFGGELDREGGLDEGRLVSDMRDERHVGAMVQRSKQRLTGEAYITNEMVVLSAGRKPQASSLFCTKKANFSSDLK
jgi:hypothetical protein